MIARGNSQVWVARGFFVAALCSLLVSIVEFVRLLSLTNYMYLENYFATVESRNAYAADIFLSSGFAVVLVIPAVAIYLDNRTERKSAGKENRRSLGFLKTTPDPVAKSLFLESLFLLELSFMVTSHLLDIDNINNFVLYQLLPRISLGGIKSFSFQDWDYYCLGLVVVLATCAFIMYVKRSDTPLLSGLETIRIIALTSLPLGIEIYLFDRPEFNVRVTQVQSSWASGWFTNADLLYLSVAVVILSSIVLGLLGRGKLLHASYREHDTTGLSQPLTQRKSAT